MPALSSMNAWLCIVYSLLHDDVLSLVDVLLLQSLYLSTIIDEESPRTRGVLHVEKTAPLFSNRSPVMGTISAVPRYFPRNNGSEALKRSTHTGYDRHTIRTQTAQVQVL